MSITQENSPKSRRAFAFGAGLLASGLVAARAQAQSTTMPGATPSDIAILNYALTLEHLEANFYVEGLRRYAATDFRSAQFAQVLGAGTVNGVYTNLSRIRDHEVAHVQTLQTTIRSLGGTPVEPCTYRFPYNSPDEFLQVAQTLEEVGVQAYAGAIAMVAATQLKAAGASIASVEARHASYLNLVNGNVPFPQAFDVAKSMREILAAASPFITACSGTPVGASTTAILLPKNLATTTSELTLDASQSLSANGQPLRFELRSISGSASIIRGNTASPFVQLSSGPGEYVFELTVTDSAGVTSMDRTTIRYSGR
jgi:hypothetical protein